MPRLFLTNKDVQRIIGKGASAAQKLIKEIKTKTNKPKFSPITVEEFCNFTGLSLHLVLKELE